ncbi:FAD/NAD-P-binding domain-containing protein [Sparassis latifolia]
MKCTHSLGGLSFGIALKQQLGFENFTIYEKAAEIGGTWRDNTYPGCNSDTPSHWYSLSTELNPNWTSTCVPGSELQEYWTHVAKKHALYEHTVFHMKVVSAGWDSEKQLYNIELEDVRSRTRTFTTAQILISAVGYLMDPIFPPGLRGLDKFKGDLFHSGRWDHTVDFRNKRVGVVGCGASAAQFIPILLEDSTVQIVNFCQTPSWFVDLKITPISDRQRWIFAHVPFALRLYRNWLVITGYILPPYLRRLRGTTHVEDVSTALIKQRAPAKYHDKLIPTYPAACRRLVMDPGYLAALHRPNISLNWDGIAEVTEDGILTKTGEVIPFDVIIFGTGFSTDTHPVSIKGTQETLQAYSAAHGGPTAYRGVTVPGFPNFYIIGGPNTTTPNTSYIFTHEVEINYAIQLVAPVVRGLASSFEVTARACDAYNAWLQAKIAGSDWMLCHSWYRTGGNGKNFGIFPGSILQFWWLLRSPAWGNYTVVGGARWEAYQRWIGFATLGAVASALVLGGALVRRDLVLRAVESLGAQFVQMSKAIYHLNAEA